MPEPTPTLVLSLGVLTVGVLAAGLVQLERGWAQKERAVRRSRLERGERASRRLRSRVEDWLRTTRPGTTLETRLTSAGIDTGTTDFLLIASAVTALGLAVGVWLLGVWLGLVVGVVTARGCWSWIGYRRGRRHEQFLGQLPDLARVLSNGAQAGLSMASALTMAATEVDDPAATEIGRVTEELRLGQSVEAALGNLETRIPSREVGVLVSTLVIQQRAGGDAVHALRSMSDTLDARKELRREVRTIMSGSVATGWIVGAVGIGSLLLLNAAQPGILDTMLASGLGRLALLTAAGLYTLGFVLIRQTTRVAT